jgi:hypothetical protein
MNGHLERLSGRQPRQRARRTPPAGYTTIATWRQTLSPHVEFFSFSVTHNKIQGNPQLQILKRSALGLT